MNEFSENWLKLRARAGNKADLLGKAWPTKKEEAYHYASLSFLDRTVWAAAEPLAEKEVAAKIEKMSLPETENRLVFANGHFLRSLSFLAEGGKLTPQSSEKAELSKEISFEARFNQAFRNEKISLHLSKKAEKQSLQLLFVNEGENISLHPAIFLEVLPGQKLSVLEAHFGEGHFLENALVEVSCAESSRISWVKAQFSSEKSVSLSKTLFDVKKEAHAGIVFLAKGNLFGREVFQGTLQDENAFLTVSGLQLAGQDQCLDFNVSVAHEANHTESHQSFKSLLIEDGHAIYQGKSAISKKGNKSEAHQKTDALLLSDKAVFDVKPELEIFADDVKCTHGATIGALEAQDIFYLRARGIPLPLAKRLLLFSFINDILESISEECFRLWAQDYIFPFLDALGEGEKLSSEGIDL